MSDKIRIEINWKAFECLTCGWRPPQTVTNKEAEILVSNHIHVVLGHKQ